MIQEIVVLGSAELHIHRTINVVKGSNLRPVRSNHFRKLLVSQAGLVLNTTPMS